MHRINKRDILSYRVRLPEIDDGSEFWIVCRNLSVTTIGARPFDDEAPPEGTVQRQATTATADPLRGQFENVSNNIGRGASAQDIAELRDAGITVDNEDPAPENAGAPPSEPLFNVGEWMKPTICPRRADSTVHDLDGSWKQNSWQDVGQMSELELFRMAFPEKWVRDVVLPSTNKVIEGGEMDLQEFYVFLGCHFFMACFEGISDRRDWWSKQTSDMFAGAPFRLSEYMSFNRFAVIAKSMTYTDKEAPNFLDRFHDV